ncbi:MAG TPA: AAA family ATPase [Anaerolineae bacterium]|nr:AAA family ATPase [Anaerolineae bacterium]HNU03079.1 AAA family ATPase [Anaerolineae bacterium]
MINAICVQNFRSIKDLTVRLGPLNVLLGKNGAGKSNFLDSLAFLADATDMGVRSALLHENRVSFEDLVYAGERHQIIAIQIEAWNNRLGFQNDDDLLFYQVGFGLNPASGREVEVGMEQLWRVGRPFLASANASHPHGQAFDYLPDDRQPLLHAGQAWREDGGAAEAFAGNMQRTALSQLSDRVRYPHAVALAAALRQFKVFRLEPQAMRKPATVKYQAELQPNGANLAAVLDEVHGDVLEAITGELRVAVPGLHSIRLEAAGPGQKVIVMREKNNLSFYPHQISDGTLRFLALAAIAHGAVAAPLLAIEEPENGISPARLFQLVELLRNHARAGQQIILTTHAPYLVDRLQPDELLVFTRNGGPTTLVELTATEIAQRQKTFGPLGELWVSGGLQDG